MNPTKSIPIHELEVDSLNDLTELISDGTKSKSHRPRRRTRGKAQRVKTARLEWKSSLYIYISRPASDSSGSRFRQKEARESGARFKCRLVFGRSPNDLGLFDAAE